MEEDLLAKSPIGRLVPIKGTDALHGPFACFAYLPNDLPSDIQIASSTWGAVIQASAAIARLDQACTHLLDPSLLIRPALWREALETSALEGTYGQLTEILEAQLPSSQYRSPETREILGYADVALHAFESIKDRPISTSLLSEGQSGIFREAQQIPRDVGKIREHQVWIGPRDASIEHARFVPAPGDDRLKAAFEQWITWVEADSPLPPVLKAAMGHYQFETLHPFGDGNGRIGRLVIVLQLLRSGVITCPAMTISPWFYRHRDEYEDHLLRVSVTGEWDPWIAFFCQAVTEQSSSLIEGANRLVDWLKQSREAINERRWTGTIHHLLEDLTQWPVISIAFASDRYQITIMAATNIVNHLVEIGVLKELTGRTYGRVFGATEVMNIVESI